MGFCVYNILNEDLRMYLLLISLPLLSSVFAGFFGRFLGGRGAVCITVCSLILCWILSCLVFYEVALCGCVCTCPIMQWFPIEMVDAEWCLYFDTLTAVMLVVITSISTLVHLYSSSYMAEDPHLPRFMSYLSIFTFFMFMLVCADNLVEMFFGWEGVGCASYLLINFWFTRLQANKSSIKAMLLNRVGDFGLTIGIMSCFFVYKSVNFSVLIACTPYLSPCEIIFCNHSFDAHTVICLCLLIGACGKSAQLGLHTWLPDAMEGPTPVSALIHAATMVTAGVFLIARASTLFECAPTALAFVSVLGGMTCFFAATTGVVQNDLKRVIAYSTCSQLGYMVFACGISSYSVAIFHLANHAFFKALLFLGAGSIIHALSDEQDMRKMGGVVRVLPFTYAMICIGSLALVGFPFLAGFYSKDVILEVAYARYSMSGQFGYWFTLICVLFTAYYSTRLLLLSFHTPLQKQGFCTALPRQKISQIHDSPFQIFVSLFLLAIASVFVGFFAQDMMIGVGTSFWGNSLFVDPVQNNRVEAEYIPQYAKLCPLLFTFLGILLATLAKYFDSSLSYKFSTSRIGSALYLRLNKRWFFDKVYNDLLSRQLLYFGYSVSNTRLDKGCFEIIGPRGIVSLITHIYRQTPRLQSGMVYHYAYTMLMGLTLYVSMIGIWKQNLGVLYIPILNVTAHISLSSSIPALLLVFSGALFIETVYTPGLRKGKLLYGSA